MRAFIIAILATLLLSCSKPAPQVAIELADGNVIHQQDWQGKWIFINYWAQWCKPCAEEIPELNQFAKENPAVLVLGINYDKPQTGELLRQANAMRINFHVVTNDIQQVFPHEMPQGLPATLVINPEGKIVDTLVGPQTRATLAQAMKL